MPLTGRQLATGALVLLGVALLVGRYRRTYRVPACSYLRGSENYTAA